MDECIFCKIIRGDIPNYTVYEDNNILAFLDIFPHVKGHVVIIPKKHVTTLEEMDEKQWKDISIGIKEALNRINDILKPDGCNVGINNKEEAGQVVPHVHWHILPRYKDDNGGSIHSIVNNANKEEVQKIAEMFK